MKKPGIYCLLAAAGALMLLLAVFQLQRGWNREPITVSRLPQTLPTAEAPLPGKERLDLNTATAEQLQNLPGIGPVLAGRILEYREKNGGFTSVSQLTMVKGIGISLLDQIMDYITVGG